ncbi:MAG: hypothetical protein ACFFDS_08020, partial [Candidatus Thorarchaeota archaeon]
KDAAIWITGSIQTESNLTAHGNFVTSGTGSVVGTFVGSQISDHTGIIRPVEIENATVLAGYKVKAGSVLIGPTDNSGLITFATNFANANWFMTLSPRTLTKPYLYQVTDLSGLVPCVSGDRRASGCWIYAGSNTVIDWIAVGM